MLGCLILLGPQHVYILDCCNDICEIICFPLNLFRYDLKERLAWGPNTKTHLIVRLALGTNVLGLPSNWVPNHQISVKNWFKNWLKSADAYTTPIQV